MRKYCYAIIVIFGACGDGTAGDGDAGDQALSLCFTTASGQSTQLDSYGDMYVARVDFNTDGRMDLLVGGDNGNSLTEDPLRVLVSDGDGSFTDMTSTYLPDGPTAARPIGVVADFNGDSIDDIAVFDAGHLELGQDPMGGYYGGEPQLLVSNSGTWTVSHALRDAVDNAPSGYCWPTCASVIHAKAAVAGDIDNDGDVDIFVESGGGYNNPQPHFMVNQGDGSFVLDASESRRSAAVIWGPGAWRYATHALADIDGDGHLDLVMGQLRKRDNDQDALASKVVFNDGAGNFVSANSVDLPYADWNGGYTYAVAIATFDFDSDGDLDILLAHERGNISPDPFGEGNTGRYLQFIRNDVSGFVDVTASYLADQSATVGTTAEPYGSNFNAPGAIAVDDLNGDGYPELMMQLSGPIGSHAPYIYSGGDGSYTALDPRAITRSDWFGENAYAIDLNGDGIVDFVHSDLQAGPDGDYGTGDETSTLIPTLTCLE